VANCALDVGRATLDVQVMRRMFWIAVVLLILPQGVFSQFAPTLLENRSYWGDGKSEIDFYQAEFMRDGEPHQCELITIFTPTFVEPNNMAPVGEGKQSGGVPAIRMTQTAAIPRGVTSELRYLDAIWRMDSMSLARLAFSGGDFVGNIAKTLRENRQPTGTSWSFSSDTYTGKVDASPVTLGAKPTLCYDELPLRLRTLDFAKQNGEAEVDLAPTLGAVSKELGEIKPAKISWKVEDRTIRVEVQHAAGKDQFTLDSNFPFLMRDWTGWDRTHWKMKNSIRADYRKYLRNGDRERALKDPMLRHPD